MHIYKNHHNNRLNLPISFINKNKINNFVHIETVALNEHGFDFENSICPEKLALFIIPYLLRVCGCVYLLHSAGSYSV